MNPKNNSTFPGSFLDMVNKKPKVEPKKPMATKQEWNNCKWNATLKTDDPGCDSQHPLVMKCQGFCKKYDYHDDE